MLVRTFHFRRARCRSGQALVEFAVVALVLTFLVAGVLTFGFVLFGANVLQQAADVGAMELARFPYSPAGDFQTALNDSGLFDEKYLVCTIGGPNTTQEDLPENYAPADVAALQSRMPLINRLLYGLYIYDRDLNAIRYPGAVVSRDSDNELTVQIPLILGRDPVTGRETNIEWHQVVEEIESNGVGPYSLLASDPSNPFFMPGMVALRLNYPFQSASMIAWQYRDKTTNAPLDVEDVLGADVDVNNQEIEAIDFGIADPPGGYTLIVAANSGSGPHAGKAGLGRLFAMGKTVRPFRRTLTAQAIYRREVFE